MQNDPTTQLLWRTKEETVERHTTYDSKDYSLSRRKHHITGLAADASPTPVINVRTDLELGAHVALMRTFATMSDSSPDLRSWTPLSTRRALPATWETA